MIRRSFLALAATFAALPAFSQEQGAAEPREITDAERKLITEINTYNSSIKTMVGRFLQIDTQGQRIEGTFFLERPGKILFRYNPPSSEQIVSVGRGFYVVDRKEKTQYAYPQDKVPLRQFLSDKIDLLRAGLVAIDHSDSYVELTLQEETPAGTVRIALVFDKDSKDLVQWVLSSPDGSELTFSLFDVEKNVAIPNTFFYLNINDYATKG